MEEIISGGRKKQIKILGRKIKQKRCEEEKLKKLFLWYYQLEKVIGEGRILTNSYNGNIAKKIVTFLKGWDAGVVLYAKNWRPNHFNKINYDILVILCEELLIKLKKKVMEVYEIQNVTSNHMTLEGDTNTNNRLLGMNQIWGVEKN